MSTQSPSLSLAGLTLTNSEAPSLGLFGKLPRELRDIIYHYAIPPHSDDEFPKIRGERAQLDINVILRNRPLLLCNKQLRAEGLQSWFKASEVAGDSYCGDLSDLLLKLCTLVDLSLHVGTVGTAHRHDYIIPYCPKDTHPELTVRCIASLNVNYNIPAEKIFIRVDHAVLDTSALDLLYAFGVLENTTMPDIPECNLKIWVADVDKSLVEFRKACKDLEKIVKQRHAIMVMDLNSRGYRFGQELYDHYYDMIYNQNVALIWKIDDMQCLHLLLMQRITGFWPEAVLELQTYMQDPRKAFRAWAEEEEKEEEELKKERQSQT